MRHVVSLDGQVVTALGFEDELVVVSHSSPQALLWFPCKNLARKESSCSFFY
ncbi:hypothetical protein HanRHA438_Chr08g0329981 [Helianthus annuus]|nr:hypothetical protein HanRHA438_Chr08g0329981 [Helianthus annuus]